MITDIEILKIYYDPTLSIPECLVKLGKKGVKTSESTLVRHIKKLGKKTRKDLKFRKNKLGFIRDCPICEFEKMLCICDGVAHG